MYFVYLQMIKDDAYYCYCAYVLRIARYSGLLRVLPTKYRNIFARFKSIRRKQNLAMQMLLVSQKKIEGNHAFFRDN